MFCTIHPSIIGCIRNLQLTLVAHLAEALCHALSPLEITNTRNQRKIKSQELFCFLEITMFWGRKIDKTEADSKRRLFLQHEKIFPQGVFDCCCMALL